MSLSQEQSLHAAEYALGTLRDDERRQFEQALARSPELEREVWRWREALQALDQAIVPTNPPASLWPRIEASLNAPIVRRPALTRRLLPWAAAAVLAIVAIVVTVQRSSERATPHDIAILMASDSHSRFTVRLGNDPEHLLVNAKDVRVAGDKSLQLWLIGPQGVPQSLGLLAAQGPNIVSIKGLTLTAGMTLAVSLEPQGGSPKATPTGPVLYQGTVTRL